MQVPVFKLYGEGVGWATPDLLHCETIPKRSRLHHWEIQPHRHADLCQLLYVHRGQAVIEVEGQRHTLHEAGLQIVPPLCVHGFQFSENIDGYVVTLAAPLVGQLQRQLGEALRVLDTPATYLAGKDRAYLHALFSAMQREYHSAEAGRDVLLHSLANVAVIWAGRQAQQRRVAKQPVQRGRDLLSRYTQAVEAHYARQPSVEELAYAIGISVAHLNSICRELAGQSPLQIVHQRVLLEAKRNLIYTAMTVSQIADRLGFGDPAYFSRFFRRLVGVSPKAFRAANAQPDRVSAGN